MSFIEKSGYFHCEKTGLRVCLNNTEILTRINGIIRNNRLINSEINEQKRRIHIENEEFGYLSKIDLPADLQIIFGDLYAFFGAGGMLEQSTALLSKKGKEIFMAQQLMPIRVCLNEREIVKFSEEYPFILADNAFVFKKELKRCACCCRDYISVGEKYIAEKIIEFTTREKRWGEESELLPGYDLAVSDCSFINRLGKGYLFSTDKLFKEINLCSNECAVRSCIENKIIISYVDFMNKAKVRILCQFTEDINTKLGNDYKYRSSRI